MTSKPAKFEVATSNSLGEEFYKKIHDLDLGFKVILSVAQYPQHHTPAKFEGAMSKG